MKVIYCLFINLLNLKNKSVTIQYTKKMLIDCTLNNGFWFILLI